MFLAAGIANADIVTSSTIKEGDAQSNLEHVLSIVEPVRVEVSYHGIEAGLQRDEADSSGFWNRSEDSKKVPEPSQLSIPVFLLMIWAFVRLERKQTAVLRSQPLS